MWIAGVIGGVCVATAPLAAQEADVVAKVNEPILRQPERINSYKIIFDAFLDVTPAPTPNGRADRDINLRTIHPGMANWQEVSAWAEANHETMGNAILASHEKKTLGLPYGDGIDQKYVSAGLYADLAAEGNLRDQDFAYLSAIDTIAAFATADTYRLFEAGDVDKAMDLAVAHLYLVDQLCEREFLAEKLHAMTLLIDSLAVLRDQMHTYFDKLSGAHYSSPDDIEMSNGQKRKGIAFELPWLRVDMLLMPEADRIVAEALVATVFDTAGGEADPDKFAATFGRLQARDAAFTQFGAARRWRMVADFHGSYKATLDHLTIVYDDWWRRWQIRAWHPLLEMDTQFERTNPVRYAAVTYVLSDMEEIFHLRRQLTAAVNGTALAAAVCGYRKQFGVDPDDIEKVFATHIQKRSDLDPFDREEKGFGYRFVNPDSPEKISVEGIDSTFVEVKGGLLWAKGSDFESNRGRRHSDDGFTPGTDMIVWPPIRALAREQGLMD